MGINIMEALRRVTRSISAKIPNSLTVQDNKLFLAKDFVPISDGVEIQVGSGGSTGYVQLVNRLSSTNLTIALNGKAELIFAYASSEDETSGGTAYVYVNDALKDTFNIIRGENTIDVGSLLGPGTNVVKITATDPYGNSKSLNYTINVIDLRITSTFDDGQIYNGDIIVRYVPVGAIDKNIIFVVDADVYDTIQTSETGKQQSYTIPAMSHGSHTLKIYMTADVNGSFIKSNELVYDIMCAEIGATTPMIGSAYSITSVIQGELISIPFTIYDPVNMETQVALVIAQGNEVYSTTTRTVDRTRQTWSTRDYPVGDVTFTITYGNVSKSHIVTIIKSEIDVSIKNSDLEFQLRAAGKSNEDDDRDVWENNGVTVNFNNVNWDSTGWVIDENGDTALRLSGDSAAIIGFKPFLSDARQTGRTIEMEFAIRDVNNREAVAISCLSDGIGFTVTADTARLDSEQSEISCKYTVNKKICVSFVIEPRTEYRLLYVYLNGVLSDVVRYTDTDNLQQTSPVNITVGSPYCSVDLYAIRSYNTALTMYEVRDNYIASITDISKRLAIYEDNNIYDVYGDLSFSKLKQKIPSLIIVGDLPAYKGDKKKVTIIYYDPNNLSLCFEAEATIDVQGTSSQWYVVKNFKIKTGEAHKIALDQIATKVLCFKADYAESTGTHNTGTANFVHILYDTKVPPQEEDERVRTTIYGHPAVIFHQADSSIEPKFVGKYNCNHDKGSEETFGFTSDYPDVQSVEFCNNTSDACLFHGTIPSEWSDDFEFRYPDGYTDISAFKEMHDWVVSTYQVDATGDSLGFTYTDVDGNMYTHDTADYRLAKFKTEFEEHFDMEYALVYYVFSFFALMVDQRCKNLFLTSWDKKHWMCYFYDNDTIFGINNQGDLTLDYYYEDVDQLGDAYVFNGATSTLWVNFKEAFWDKIKEKYRQLRSDKKLTKENLTKYYITDQADKWSISIYNEDSDYKYISMVRSDDDASNLNQVRGNGVDHFDYIVDNRFMYCDSMMYAGDYPDDYISLRIYTPIDENDNPRTDLVVTPNANITVTPYSNMYIGAKYKANGTLLQYRAEANIPVTFTPPVNSDTGESEVFNNTETAVYGASQISSLGDLSALYCGSVKVAKAEKLTELIVGSGIEGYSNENLWELEVGTNSLLKKIDVRNCPKLLTPLALANCPNIQEIYATGSGITGVELPSSGYLKKVYLPKTLTNLTVTNQQYIEEFQLDGYDALTTLRIENTIGIPVEDIMLNAPNLNRVRLIDIVWNAESETALVQTIEKFKSCLGLDENGNNTNNAVVTGRVKVAETVSDEVLGNIYNNFPDLVVDDGSSDIYIINYKDWDGTILYTDRLADGANAIDPIEKGYIDEPFRASDEYYSYEFVGWNLIPTNVNKHYQVIAQYHTKVAVNFCVDGEIIHSEYVVYGADAEDPVEDGTIELPIKEGTDDLRYAFNGWDKSLTNVTLPRNINAVWTNVYPVRFYATESSQTPHYTQWVKETENAHDPIAANECQAPSDIVTDDITYVFSHWNNIPENVTAIENVYAEYSSLWAVRFYNGYLLEDTQWIAIGQSAVDPVRAGRIPTPIRTSTAQYDYTFSGWEGDYTNVTEARKIMATYNATIRKYSVYFYNGDELLQTIEGVQYGDRTSYTGVTPVKTGVDNPEEYVFKGWMPAPENITGETECYALFKFTGYLFGKLSDDNEYGTIDDPNWDKINLYWTTIGNDVESYKNGSMSEDDFKQKYQIGGRMIIPIELTDGTSTIADVEVIAHNHDDLADNSGKATLTIFVKELPDMLRRMNEYNNDTGSWESSAMRQFVNGELFEALPGELKSIIKPVLKISDSNDNNKTLVTTIDYCWLASYDEVGFISGNYNAAGQGELYSSIFSNDKASRKKYVIDNTETGGWWLRSSYYTSSSNTMFWRVQKSGSSYGDIQTGLFYVAFGFCI